MKLFFKIISILFHPILMPLIGVTFYFSKSPRYFSQGLIYSKLLATLILTIIVPLLIYSVLKSFNKVKSILLKTPSERIWPVAINCIITLMLIVRVFPKEDLYELHYFFIGILISSLSSLLLNFIELKPSLHIMGVSGTLTLFILLSIYFSINITGTLALMFVILGVVATARLYLKAHTPLELLLGLLLGFFPQLILINYWY